MKLKLHVYNEGAPDALVQFTTDDTRDLTMFALDGRHWKKMGGPMEIEVKIKPTSFVHWSDRRVST